MAIDMEVAGHYIAIDRSILKRYDFNEQSYRHRLRARMRKPNESYVNLATDIMGLGKKWVSECKDISDTCCQTG